MTINHFLINALVALEVQEYKMIEIVYNCIECRHCGDKLVSMSVHDFKMCACGRVGVDGGKDYLRRCGNREDYIDHSLVLPASYQLQIIQDNIDDVKRGKDEPKQSN